MKPRTTEEEERLTPMEEEMQRMESQIRWLKAQLQAVRDRTLYKQFCKHPHLCANTGRCQAEWVCND